MNLCMQCNTETKNKKFCSKSCAASYNRKGRKHTTETKQKISSAVSKNPSGVLLNNKGGSHRKGKINPSLWVSKECPTCKNKFTSRIKSNKVFCSKECVKTGGYRENSGRGKRGFYKGIYCASTYELCWLIYQLDHGIPVRRFPSFLENEEVKYYPDFLLPDGKTIIEIKGYDLNNMMTKKIRVANQNGYEIKVLYRDDLATEFDYVKSKYGSSKFESLYDMEPQREIESPFLP